jgi:asparagine synthase (glutamine-hydrolysing)
MCGIAGYLGSYNPELLPLLGRTQAHRGPDHQAYWSADQVGLAHQRLSILDLSPSGHQPMWDERKRVVLIFNGEIYNYRELRQRLESAGVSFQGTSDTEVLVNLLSLFGSKSLAWLNGIFALAAWFPEERRMLLARDAAGVKPLYWAHGTEGYAFASEIKTLRVLPGLDWSIDQTAIMSYLSLLYAPGDLTPARGIRKVLPGTFMEWRLGQTPQTTRFASAPYQQEIQDLSFDDSVEACRHYLQQAVRRQLVADVPVGGFLSGGVDSTAIAHFAVQALGAGSRYPCFTIGSSENAALAREGFADDYPYAQLASQRLGVPLGVASQSDIQVNQVDEMVAHLDEPIADLASLTTLTICQKARQEGIKVLLSGAGGDDLFSGYRRHQAIESEKYWRWWPLAWRRRLKHWAVNTEHHTPFARRFSKLFRYADSSSAERLAGYFLWIEENTLAMALHDDFRHHAGLRRPVDLLTSSLTNLPASATSLQQMLHLDRNHFLADQNLVYTDKMSMACGVEVRVPFLDLDLMQFSERLPDAFKQSGSRGKFILKQAMQGLIPHEIIHRPKSGFGLPLRQLLHTVYAPRLKELADSGRLDATGIFSGKGVLRLLAEDAQGKVDAAYPLLGILCVESWLRQFAHR